MIAAGINYFIAKNQQIEWICHRPVFYDGSTDGRDISRRSCIAPISSGRRMFIDEPACRLAGKYPTGCFAGKRR